MYIFTSLKPFYYYGYKNECSKNRNCCMIIYINGYKMTKKIRYI